MVCCRRDRRAGLQGGPADPCYVDQVDHNQASQRITNRISDFTRLVYGG